jgi:hypothetical protein
MTDNLPPDITHAHPYFWLRDEDDPPNEPDPADYDDREEE